MDDLTLPQKQLLLVDSDEAFGRILEGVLGSGYRLRRASTVEAGISHLDAADLDAVMLSLDQQNGGALVQDPASLLQAAANQPVPLPVIVYGWDTRREAAVQMMQQGATDFFAQPLDIKDLKFALDRAYRRTALMRELAAAQQLLSSTRIEGLLGASKAMDRINEIIRKVAGVFTTVLVTGESGTGKEIVARAIHRLSSRADKPFVAFAACALPETLLEDELFGHEKGAFTGASASRRGRFEEAKGGTIFLDEIGDLALPLQAKLLRVLQERVIERLGSNAPVPVDVRVICATSRNLEKMVHEGTFREDLFFRISVVRIHMPPLRERPEDVSILAHHFLRTFSKTHARRVPVVTPGFMSALASQPWPGNVRELQNVIERTLVLSDENAPLTLADLPPEFTVPAVPAPSVQVGSFQEAIKNYKRELVRAALRMHLGNRMKAAQELHISRCYLHRLLNQLNIEGASAPSPEDETGIPLEGEDAPEMAVAGHSRRASRAG